MRYTVCGLIIIHNASVLSILQDMTKSRNRMETRLTNGMACEKLYYQELIIVVRESTQCSIGMCKMSV